VPDSVDGVEREWCGQDCLSGILEGIRETTEELYEVGRVESSRRDEVCQEVAVKY
jgi:hypothetical protein